MAGPAALVVPALKKHTATVIMAHGLGDSGAGWVGLAESWRRRGKFEEVSFIFPNAPSIPITVNFGMKMPGCPTPPTLHKPSPAALILPPCLSSHHPLPNQHTPQTSFSDIHQNPDEAGILRSRSTIHALITQQIASGIPASRIAIGGFSQGGALSVLSGITCPHKLGGIFGLSCYLLMHSKVREMVPAENPNKETPIWMAHGEVDPLLKLEWAVNSVGMLREWGWKVEFTTYPGLAHSADPKEIDDLENYLQERLPPVGDGARSGS
ncbi:hypothetical protein MMC16_002837 [Acarospora aff. strigata]|nr:hypothetical protein [Acarospora aff. strigata]